MGVEIPSQQKDLHQEVVEEYESLVYNVAYKIAQRLARQVDVEDLVGWGYAGLIEAYQRYEPESGSQFSTFAYYRIRGAILDALSGESSDREARTAQGFNEIFENYAHVVYNRNCTHLDERINMLGELSSNLATVVILSESPERAFRSDAAPHNKALIREQTQELVRGLIDRLPDMEATLLRQFYFEDRSLSEIGLELGHSPSWASRVHTRALDRLRRMIESDPALDDLTYALPI